MKDIRHKIKTGNKPKQIYCNRWRTAPHFRTFCETLLATNRRLHLWAASCYHTLAPVGWQLHVFTRPLRNPPVVTREVELSDEIGRDVTGYTHLAVPAPTDGPSVKRIFHQGAGHSATSPGGCKLCGGQVRDFLHSLRVGAKTEFLTPGEYVTIYPEQNCLNFTSEFLVDDVTLFFARFFFIL